MSVRDELDYQETIDLLQEEIVRLENEIRVRDEARSDSAEPEDHRPAADDGSAAQVASLLDELASREETINLLLEQARLSQESESADRANWEQLNQWVYELEQRIESGVASEPVLAVKELEAERRKMDSERETFQTERRTWDAQRAAIEAEAEELRGMLAQAARQSANTSDAVLKGLEQENHRLRVAVGELARVSAVAAQAEELRDRLASLQTEHAQAQRGLQELIDDRERERMEHEAIVNELRSQAARETLKRQEAQVLNAIAPTVKPAKPSAEAALSPDDRIRAFRLHLKEIHEREAEERAQRSISARLSRLWRNTGPRG